MALLNMPKRGPYKKNPNTIKARAAKAGISLSGLRKRMAEKGMTLEEALAKPARWNTRAKK